MTLDDDISKIKSELKEVRSDLSTLKNRPSHTERTGLYIMTFIAMLAAASSCDKLNKIYKPKTENVIGEEAPDKFYELDGKRAYLEIDGKPLENR